MDQQARGDCVVVIISAIIDQTVGALQLNCDDGFRGGSLDRAAVKTQRKLKRDREKRGMKKTFRSPETGHPPPTPFPFLVFVCHVNHSRIILSSWACCFGRAFLQRKHFSCCIDGALCSCSVDGKPFHLWIAYLSTRCLLSRLSQGFSLTPTK